MFTGQAAGTGLAAVTVVRAAAADEWAVEDTRRRQATDMECRGGTGITGITDMAVTGAAQVWAALWQR